MKRFHYLHLFGLVCGLSLLTGCLFKPARVPTRYFVLAPIPEPTRAPVAAQQLSLEIGFVKMPAYLQRDALVVRKSAQEIDYLEDALWAERLDRGFRQTLADNLSSLLASERVQLAALTRNGVRVKVSVEVKQFDVDAQGRGRLSAWWRLTAPGSDQPLQSGLARLTRTGPPPRDRPQVIATTLSDLLAQFSQDLAKVIRASTRAAP